MYKKQNELNFVNNAAFMFLGKNLNLEKLL